MKVPDYSFEIKNMGDLLSSIDIVSDKSLEVLCSIDDRLRDITTLLTVIAARCPQMQEQQRQQ